MNENIINFLRNYEQLLTINIHAIKSKKIKSKNDRNVLTMLVEERSKLVTELTNLENNICLR